MAHDVISEFEARRVQRLLQDLHLGRLGSDERVTVSGQRDGDWLMVRWVIDNTQQTLVYPVDARVDLKSQRLRERDGIDLLYDLLGAQLESFLQTRDPFTGPNWEEVNFAAKQVWLRGQIRNDAVEASGSSLLDADAVVRSRALTSPDPAEADTIGDADEHETAP